MSLEITAIFILCTALAVVLSAYDRKVRELNKLKVRKQEFEDKARQRAENIISEARNRALSILEEVKLDAGKEEEGVREKLDEVARLQVIDYKNKLHNISNYIERRLNEEADNFRIALETETIGTQQAVAKKINDKYARLEQELEEYKKHRWEEIESKLAEIIKQVSQKVLGKSLGVQEHSDLIIQALEEAKRKNVI
ncbi:hypothetical protein A2W16_01305 [Candidatus Amesbacteria bacterium RBG_16_48_31]|nr:MAG: hypothetical protein A2W16_01305 [Candidatus Amesbacteria bacterium RBG_16_48_31]